MQRTYSVLGITIDVITKHNALLRLRSFFNSSSQHQVATINPEFILAAQNNLGLKEILNTSSLRLVDGVGVLWAAKFLSLPRQGMLGSIWQMVYSGALLVFKPSFNRSVIPERISGTDLVFDLCRIAAEEKQRVFFLGAKPGIAQQTAYILKKSFPGLVVAGVSTGPSRLLVTGYRLRVDEKQDQDLISQINASGASILFVAFGNPKQEYWISKYLKQMPLVKIAIGVGGAFDFISGSVKRAPGVFRSLGLEWLWRLVVQPWRLPRIMTATIKFIYAVLMFKYKKRNVDLWILYLVTSTWYLGVN